MTEELVFYTNPMSRGRIARWMLEEVGVPYRTEYLDFGTTMKAPDYLSVNPMGKVPAIRHGDTIVTERAAICAYMAETFPETGLAPTAAERGDYFRWMLFAQDCWRRPSPTGRSASKFHRNACAWRDVAVSAMSWALSRRPFQPRLTSPATDSRPPTSMSAPI